MSEIGPESVEDIFERLEHLSAKKRSLLIQRLNQKGEQVVQEQRIPRISRREGTNQFPLSFAQERLWFLDQWSPGTHLYNHSNVFQLDGLLNQIILEKCLNEIVSRHEILRTTFPIIDGQPVQLIVPSLTLALPLIDLQDVAEATWQTKIQQLVTEVTQQSFDLAEGPLVRAILLRLAPTRHVVVLTIHHIVSDGWSVDIFINELLHLYEAFLTGKPASLPQLTVQYGDFAVWQREWLQGEVVETQLAYWKRQLRDVPAMLQLPTDHPRPPIQTFSSGEQTLILSESLTEALKIVSQQEKATLFMTLLAAFKILLHFYTNQADICIGTFVSNRNRSGIEPLIGCFYNNLVLRTDLSGTPSFRELLQRVKRVALEAYSHQDLPFEKLLEELQPERMLSHPPLFQVAFALRNRSNNSTLNLPDLTVSPVNLKAIRSYFDITLSMSEEQEGLSGTLIYNSDLFNPDTMVRMTEHFQSLLETIVTYPDQPLSEISFLTEVEQRWLMKWNNTQTPYRKEATIPQLFERQVEQTPDAIAVVYGDQQFTYGELNRRANQLAHYLQKLGVGPDSCVGICIPYSLEMIVGLLGILKAGGAYVPLDPTYPQERLSFMLEDGQIAVLLTKQQLLERLPGNNLHTVCLDTDWESIASESLINPVSELAPSNLIYVIYTSGSTGRPKGAGVCHQSFTNLINWFVTEFKLTTSDKTLLITSLSFDLTQKNIFAPLIVGGVLHFLTTEYFEPDLIVQQVQDKQITWLNCTPSAFYPVIDRRHEFLQTQLASLRYLFLGGEPISGPLLKKWIEAGLNEITIVNTYGPTECTDICAFHRLGRPEEYLEKAVPIGKPNFNVKLFVLGPYLNRVPMGVAGELWVAGEGVGRGYVNDPALTLGRFVSNPFCDQPGERFYRTGDLVRYLPDGNIEFLGRMDHQVKIRGFRIEIEELEVALNKHPLVQETVVIAREDIPGEKYLVAYVVPNQHSNLTPDELRLYLKEKLPDYMVPSIFVLLDKLPLTPNGKLNRRALPLPDSSRTRVENAPVAPRNSVEEILVKIWSELLRLRQVGVYDNFFDLGGHSLLATQVISRLRHTFQIDLQVRTLFEKPTIAEMSNLIIEVTSQDVTELPSIPTIGPASREEYRMKWSLQEGLKSHNYSAEGKARTHE